MTHLSRTTHTAHPDEQQEGHHQHDHSHGHEHHSRWSKIRHRLDELFGGHSHDATDTVDTALEANARGRRALWISLIALAVTAALQGVVVFATGSVALLSDTLHNVVDALTAVPLLVAFALAKRPANKRFTYGYGRAEDLAGLFVLAMIILSAVLAAYEAVRRLLNPQPVQHLWAVAAAGVIGLVGNELVARYRIRVGRQIGSAALVADGLHARTDGFTSLAVVVGAGGVAIGLPWADPAIGLIIAVAILSVLRSAAAQVGARLMDAVDPHLVDQAREAVSSVDGVLDVRELRLRWIGHTLRAEVDVTVSADLPVREAHELAHHAEEHLLTYVPRLTAALVHVSPEGVHD